MLYRITPKNIAISLKMNVKKHICIYNNYDISLLDHTDFENGSILFKQNLTSFIL